uniref:Uncharacterized protein n=3 Tax=Pseudomonas TaxID=286 RepID=A0A6F8PB86_PSEAI|nr:hypothetical protein [Pseudomonas abietaniphila]BBJ01507.1 hypothetical protein [Pseudomonas aeruginosa]BBJ01636.1 hypothetical protein [Pseudomonas putida]
MGGRIKGESLKCDVGSQASFEEFGETGGPDLNVSYLTSRGFRARFESGAALCDVVGFELRDQLDLVFQPNAEQTTIPVQGWKDMNDMLDFGERDIEPEVEAG